MRVVSDPIQVCADDLLGGISDLLNNHSRLDRAYAQDSAFFCISGDYEFRELSDAGRCV